VLDDFKLGMLAFGDDEITVEGTISLELGDVLHHRIIRADGISSNDIYVGQSAGDSNSLAAAD
jgi:hypothetical protein